MEKFEPGSVLKESDCKKQSRREEFGLTSVICAMLLIVAFRGAIIKVALTPSRLRLLPWADTRKGLVSGGG
jgi:hypothetical protein